MKNRIEKPITSWTPLTNKQRLCLRLPKMVDIIIWIGTIVAIACLLAFRIYEHNKHHNDGQETGFPNLLIIAVAIYAFYRLSSWLLGIAQAKVRSLLDFDCLYITTWLSRDKDGSLRFGLSKPLNLRTAYAMATNKQGDLGKAVISALIPLRHDRWFSVFQKKDQITDLLIEWPCSWKMAIARR